MRENLHTCMWRVEKITGMDGANVKWERAQVQIPRYYASLLIILWENFVITHLLDTLQQTAFEIFYGNVLKKY